MPGHNDDESRRGRPKRHGAAVTPDAPVRIRPQGIAAAPGDLADDPVGPLGPTRIRPFWGGGFLPNDYGPKNVIWVLYLDDGMAGVRPPAYDELAAILESRGLTIADGGSFFELLRFRAEHLANPDVCGIFVAELKTDADTFASRATRCIGNVENCG